MKTSQEMWTAKTGWHQLTPELEVAPQLVLAFGSTSVLQDAKLYKQVAEKYLGSNIIWCSTAGEILDTQVHDDSLCITAVHFEKTNLQFAQAAIKDVSESKAIGAQLASSLPTETLQHVLVFSDGLSVNGSELIAGITANLPKTVSVTGGLVADGSNFEKTLVSLNASPAQGNVILVGLFSKSLNIGFGSLGGWDTFGPKRTITKSKNNVVYEIDNKPALELYKTYLGDQAKNLPSSALLFPLNVQLAGTEEEVVRTILNVNEADQSMTFAGDVPEGSTSQLMRANFERLIDGASGAAANSTESLKDGRAELALLISCVGRKLVLKERTEEEVEAVRDVVGNRAAITGFYSYGELCPTAASQQQCQLHNQTMTITTIRED